MNIVRCVEAVVDYLFDNGWIAGQYDDDRARMRNELTQNIQDIIAKHFFGTPEGKA